MTYKVRFAPSPTGFLHIGNARIAIVNYLFCKQNNGKFVLRIDDTDIVRSSKEYEEKIKEDLAWLGVQHDEFFRQSDRIERYCEIKDKLIDSGALYRCYETQEELEYKRRRAISEGKMPVYDRAALELTEKQKEKLENDGVASYFRFKLPAKNVQWNDIVLNEVSYDLRSVSDPIVIKADGGYLYTFSSVVDDIDSNITHIIRGQDHVTNTAVQIALFDEILGECCKMSFGHLSLLVNHDGGALSKRLGSLNLEDMKKQGIEPMAINSLLATIGSAKDVRPISAMGELVEYFDIAMFSKNSPKFDIKDVVQINTKLLRKQTYEQVLGKIGAQNCPSKDIFDIVRENIENFDDYAVWKNIFSQDFVGIKLANVEILKIAIEIIESFDILETQSWKMVLNAIKEKSNVAGRALYAPIRLALTSLEHGPNIVSIMNILGKQEVLSRLNNCVLK